MWQGFDVIGSPGITGVGFTLTVNLKIWAKE